MPVTSFALGEIYNPVNVQIQQDPWDAFVQQSQQQSQVDSLNQSLKNIQNAISNQTVQQAQLQQQQLIQQTQAQCPPNTTVYVSKITGKIGGCICQAPYTMQNGSCVSSYAQPTAPTTNSQLRDATCKAWYGPTARASATSGCDLGIPATMPATQVQQKSNNEVITAPASGGGGGGSTYADKIACYRAVRGEITYFGTLTLDECDTVWQKAVEDAQKKNTVTAALAPKVHVDRTDAQAATVSMVQPVATTTVSRTVATRERGLFSLFGLWPWLFGLFSL